MCRLCHPQALKADRGNPVAALAFQTVTFDTLLLTSETLTLWVWGRAPVVLAGHPGRELAASGCAGLSPHAPAPSLGVLTRELGEATGPASFLGQAVPQGKSV